MPIIKKTVWMARCDRCRKKFGEGVIFPFATQWWKTSRAQLLEGLDDQLWVVKRGRILCDDCSFKEKQAEERAAKEKKGAT